METPEQRARVHVVDDEEAVLRVFQRLFRSHYLILTVASGVGALQAMRDQVFDVVDVDYQNPIR